MISEDPWRIYVAARKKAFRVYHDTIRVTKDAFKAVDKEASKIYMETIEKARLKYKEAAR